MTGVIGLLSFFLFIWVFMWMSVFELNQEQPLVTWRIPIFCVFHGKHDVNTNVSNHKNEVTFKNTILNHTDDGTLENIIFRDTDLTLECFGEKFHIDFTLHNTLHQDTKKRIILNKKGGFELLTGTTFNIYRGSVRDKKNSLVFGFFSHTDNFQGYVITDQMYGFESTIEEGERQLICYRFKDLILSDCLDDDKTDCSQPHFFKPFNLKTGGKGSTSFKELNISRYAKYKISKNKNEYFSNHDNKVEKTSSPIKLSTIEESSKMEQLGENNSFHFTETIIPLLAKTYTDGENKYPDFPFKFDLSVARKITSENIPQDELVMKSKSEELIVRESKNMTKHLSLESTKKLFVDESKNLLLKSSTLEAHDISCGLRIVASQSLMEFFEKNITYLVKDIYLQTEMLNILYEKITFKSNTRTFKVKFRIENIILPNENLAENSTHYISIGELIKKYSLEKSFAPACLIVGLDMTLPNTENYLDHSYEHAIPCADGKNIIIVSHGTLEKPKSMALYLASYIKAITWALGATDRDKACHLGSPPNPFVLIEKYFLSKLIEPTHSREIFSECNVREIEKSLSSKKCVKETPSCDGVCIGNSSNCTCISSRKPPSCEIFSHCVAHVCSANSLKPCQCRGKHECMACCIHGGKCQVTKIRDTHIWKRHVFLAFPDGSKCSKNGSCYNGACIRDNNNYSIWNWKSSGSSEIFYSFLLEMQIIILIKIWQFLMFTLY